MAQTKPNFWDQLVRDVTEVLTRMGGSAHQTVVVDCVAAMHRQRGETVNDLPRMIVEALEHYRDLFVRPFGEGSQRWALAGHA
ncbi:hypothetical protein ASG17_05710 [Brevundimonas sp. Leaf363]|uniref:hypothetical protein n=1 Tax=Brevundimonas sp. Leaf363 TaxID=1736353 RepID=UPI0006F35D60|nr:hypothetical protein [Brevundimonas sp. Leaf363]KQS55569.1 hypothetical protein ASG17_05710 [Brevundimonas sp. Leaf363]RZJ40774.1 MAG: hypothetical protein EON87_17450 [Brevundimonas sp.]